MVNSIERKLKKQGFKFIIGLDEAGRGPLAGPVVAVAILIKCKMKNAKCKIAVQNLKLENSKLKIKDSKRLSQKRREEIFESLKNDPRVVWGRGMVSAQVIDKINIWEATKLAMKRAVKHLEKKFGQELPANKTALIIDGNLKINSQFFEIPVVKADEKERLCILASIFAKVIRDRLMKRYHKIYPQYNFQKHKGYPTKEHKLLIRKNGPSKIHRRSFQIHYS